MFNAFTFNVPTLVFEMASARSREFFGSTPDAYARAFYSIFTLLMVGVGVCFITSEVLWRKSYAGIL